MRESEKEKERGTKKERERTNEMWWYLDLKKKHRKKLWTTSIFKFDFETKPFSKKIQMS
jgi:hypothetical protein